MNVFYLPLERDDDEVPRAVAKLGATVEQVLADSGLSEDELAALLDPTRHRSSSTATEPRGKLGR